ncbi:alpha-glucosidase family protein [Paucibacter sp. R3-3]|uniref:Alpha-glucosidase family protein n=1 Tax=Roseateles agri TaxID=3098619 RepID=A0ABU5DSG3_9BURK|nr:alpha-glucosidase family protein [Paucibacter sp. R3-3]MDY0748635.1 alpha-glucosidase family protein [Paucibacter sp. R3-3]
MANNDWWRGGVIYQIYPRSFADSNGDGIGDLKGITARLEHVAKLGADGIWLSPFFKSPMKDFGYDISDYCDVDPMFGTLADLRELITKAHALGLKVMIDQVYSHTADAHPWFIESRENTTNPKADWYVWADARDDGNPPNNWLSIFGGSAWQWDTRRKQYYLHNFLTSQPDLNFHNPEVQQAVLDSVKFWLDFGVDGYRLDVVNFYFHDKQLRSNPGRGMPDGSDPAVTAVNPYAWQWHKFDKSQPENLEFLKKLRALLDTKADTTMVGEIGDDDGLARVAEYTGGGDKLHMAYCFDLLGEPHSAPYLHGVFARFAQVVGSGWPCWAITNHDIPRVATRWGGKQAPVALVKLAAALQLSLRGSACIYQGDELGLPEAEIAYEDLQDPYGITMWPEFKGRDGCRTPMPWDSTAKDLGFSSANPEAKPWLPVAETHRALAADVQQHDPASVLNFYRRFLAWRRTQPVLIHGEMTLLPADEQVLAFVREHDGQRMLCAFNLSERGATLALPAGMRLAQPSPISDGAWTSPSSSSPDTVSFAPWGMLLAPLN